LLARLRQPRGFVNPRAFDYQAWLLQQAYGATGYVRAAYPATRLQNNSLSLDSLALAPTILSAELRTKLRERIDHADLSARGRAVILALTLGDKQRLSKWWQDLARMGIVHLLVISGLHIGLIALLGTLVGSGLNRGIILFRQLLFRLGLGSSAISSMPWIAPLCGLLAAFLYSLLAGFSLPTQRALIAVAVIVAARLCYRKIRPLLCMLWALLLIAISQPLAVLSAGFWLSFTAVGLLVWWFTPLALKQKTIGFMAIGFSPAGTIGRHVSTAIAVSRQGLVACAAGQSCGCSMGFIYDCVAVIVWRTYAVEFLAGIFWQWADWSIVALWWLLDSIPQQLSFIVSPLAISPQVLCAVILAGLALLLPRGFAARWIALLPLVLLLAFPKADIPLRITVLDVGQGLAVTVKIENHTLVYDTGVEYSKQFSAGSGIIAPYLWQQGRGRIDTTVVSHEDADHSGGLVALQKVLPSQRILAGPAVIYKDSVIKSSQFMHCNDAQDWLWDGIAFQVLAAEDRPDSGNNSSCVLLISFRNALGRQVNILLPGDIERSGELTLLKLHTLEDIALDLLIAPHHGSKTSSTEAFVRLLAPEHVVFSAGYRHQFGHPHRTVVQRYRQVGSKLWNTGEQGAITFSWLSTGELEVSAARDKQLRWWR
jgi:competence protein ComEC